MASKKVFRSLWLCIPAKTKTNVQKILFVVAVILLVPQIICAQAPMPEMISYAAKPGMPDVVNTSSLNVHLEIPLYYKKVKGIDVAYNLTYDSNNDITREALG